MELIILGRTSDNKGTQLEKLTASILEEQGYTNIYTNVVNAGASEVDIKADYKLQFLSKIVTREVIGECKAYSKPISLPDWLKFLGKIFSAELSGTQVQGCFIALSGVNGNVVGHFDTVKLKRPDIILLAGEDLNNLLQQHFEVKNINDIQAIIQRQTAKNPINYAICYYEGKFYWRVSFAENSYTLLKGDGTLIATNDISLLHDLVIKESDLLTYIDLLAEKNSSERHELLCQYITSTLLIENLFLNANEVLSKVDQHFGEGIKQLKLAEIKAALTSLEQFKIVQRANDKYNLMLFADSATLQDILIFYGYFTYQSVIVKGLQSPNYGVKINEAVLDHIVEKQGNVKLTVEKYAECLQLIKWSPSALAWGMISDPNITNHRTNGLALAPNLETHDSDYFVRMMYNLFSIEFKSQAMSEYFFNLGIRELDTRSTIKVTSDGGNEISNQSNERIGLGRMSEEYENQVIPINLLDNKSVITDIDHSKTAPLK
jgi:hypothetical protein